MLLAAVWVPNLVIDYVTGTIIGAGKVGLVADNLNRNYLGLDLFAAFVAYALVLAYSKFTQIGKYKGNK